MSSIECLQKVMSAHSVHLEYSCVPSAQFFSALEKKRLTVEHMRKEPWKSLTKDKNYNSVHEEKNHSIIQMVL